MTRDLVAGVSLLIFSVVYYLAAAAIPASQLADSVGAGGMPKSYGIALGILSVLLILQTLYARRRRPTTASGAMSATKAKAPAPNLKTPRQEVRSALRAAGILVIGVVYVLVLPYLGYVVSLALLIFATAWYQERKRGRWLPLIAIVGALVFWGIFVQTLEIDEPAGLWPSFF
ncbi:MAG TPA: tripartite tricarboxylate transporter TctB family protein [Dongiaceae bacterium]|jgi:hypothetical protein